MHIIQETPSQLVLESKVIFGLLGTTTYVFDKSEGKLRISGKGLFGSKPKEHPLAGITGAALQEQAQTASERADSSSRAYRIELTRQGDSTLPLTIAYSSGKKSKEQIVEAINRFLATRSGDKSLP